MTGKRDSELHAQKLRMSGRYNNADELELSGDTDALSEFARLAQTEQTETCSLSIPQDLNPAPYDDFLDSIKIEPSEAAVVVSRSKRLLIISGSKEGRRLLAANIEWLAAQQSSGPVASHLHLEHYPGHFLSSESIPLVIVKVRD